MVAQSAVGAGELPAGLPDLPSFDFLPHREVVVQRHDGQMTSDAGLLPVRQFDEQCRYTERLAACIGDTRLDPAHPVLQMVRQRLYGVVADYEDCNDHDDLRDDPVFKLVAGRLPGDGSLASQPTPCRFENAVSIPALHALTDFLVGTGVERLKERHGGRLPARVTLDLDATDDPAHGNRQLALFHGYYARHQYFPLVIIISEPTTRHVFSVWLRHGTAHAALGAEDDLLRVVAALRKERPDIRIHVRGTRRSASPGCTPCARTTGCRTVVHVRAVHQRPAQGDRPAPAGPSGEPVRRDRAEAGEAAAVHGVPVPGGRVGLRPGGGRQRSGNRRLPRDGRVPRRGPGGRTCGSRSRTSRCSSRTRPRPPGRSGRTTSTCGGGRASTAWTS